MAVGDPAEARPPRRWRGRGLRTLNDAETIARLFGDQERGGDPCAHRAVMSVPVSGAIAHSSDVAAKRDECR